MNGVMDSVQVQLLCQLSQFELAGGCTVFGSYTQLQVFFGGSGYYFAQQFSELLERHSRSKGTSSPKQRVLSDSFGRTRNFSKVAHCATFLDNANTHVAH